MPKNLQERVDPLMILSQGVGGPISHGLKIEMMKLLNLKSVSM